MSLVPPDVMRAVLETHEFEMALHGSRSDALEAALVAGLRLHEQRIRETVAIEAETAGREMVAAAEEDPEDDGVPLEAVTLGWFADKIRKDMDLDPSGEYDPEDGDVVEVRIIGQVSVGGFAIGSHPTASLGWSITDDFTGLQFVFPAAEGVEPQIRVISRAKERAPQELSGGESDSAQEEQ